MTLVQALQIAPKTKKQYLTFTSVSGGNIKLIKNGQPYPIDMYVSYDNFHTSAKYEIASTLVLSAGQSVSFYNKTSLFSMSANIEYKFSMTGLMNASGNIMSLVNFCPTITTTHMFRCLFQKCTTLITAPKLPACILNDSCYLKMFQGCSLLTVPPVLPAKTLTKECYKFMFQNCKSLSSVPKLPATTLANYCYTNMFYGCTSLSTAPELPATTLANYCYNSMFANCSSLNYISVNFTSWTGINTTTNWTSGVSTTGTFICPTNLELLSGINNIPNNWKVIEKINY